MPCPGLGPCESWDLDLSCVLVSGTLPDLCLGDGTPVPQSIIDSATLAASQLVWALTGRQFGVCEVTIRPCRRCANECCLPQFTGDSLSYGYPWYPFHQADGTWINIACPCENECSCTKLCEILLPSPVCSVEEVLIDGVIIDPATYRVDDFRKLVRVGDECWPRCNNLTLPDSEEGTWSVTLTYGKPIPEIVRLAAAEFAGELIKGCMGGPCKLPQRLSTITRQGVTVSFLDSFDMLQGGLTGLYLVDLAIKTFNPSRLTRRPAIWSPDAGPNWRVTGT